MDKTEKMVQFGSYEEFKGVLGTELQQEAESFVRIGYLLKVARDTEILSGSGYGTVAEFAAAEYGLTKDIVSRYIAINDKYSEGGYSEVLQEKYRLYGYSKLAEMLTLPPAVADGIPPEATRAEIQEIKKELREEQKISPIELMSEEQQAEQGSLLYRFLREYYHGKPGEYGKAHEIMALRKPYDDKEYYASTAMDLLAPSGNVVMMSRVPGAGRMMMIIRDSGRPELLNVRTSEKVQCGWDEIVEVLIGLCPLDAIEDSWNYIYGEPYPMAKSIRDERSGKADKTVMVSKRPDGKPEKKDQRKDKEKPPEKPKGQKAAPTIPKDKEMPKQRKPDDQRDEQPVDVQRVNEAKVLNARHLVRVASDAIDKGRFVSARNSVKYLLEVLTEICETQESMDIDGQLYMAEIIGGMSD